MLDEFIWKKNKKIKNRQNERGEREQKSNKTVKEEERNTTEWEIKVW